ncbi:hypothetical protein HNP33_000619 [Comamonas odontotermitis]|uniref:Uncharacterized protein n=1 Tax=Comamonas odontotermitis TaxID=379895 RepID=A0ABR6RBN4_9BURK|nr:hypothetical protein [Comamonas odontotermitis]
MLELYGAAAFAFAKPCLSLCQSPENPKNLFAIRHLFGAVACVDQVAPNPLFRNQ